MFSQDINNSFREKLLILYLLNEAHLPLSMGEIEEILLPEEIMELLTISKNLSELVETNLVNEITDGNQHLYELKEMGLESLTVFKEKINDYHKAKLDMAINVFKRKKSKERFIKAEYKKVGKDETIVECHINEMDKPLIKLELRVPTNEEAERICDAWNKRGVEIFQEILKVLS